MATNQTPVANTKPSRKENRNLLADMIRNRTMRALTVTDAAKQMTTDELVTLENALVGSLKLVRAFKAEV